MVLSLGTSDPGHKSQKLSRSFPFDSGFRCRRGDMLGRCLTSVVVVFCLLVVAESDKPNVVEIRNRCRDENKLLEEQVLQLNATSKVETSDPDVKCFIKCMMVSFGIMTEDGEITSDGPSGAKYNVSPCKDVKGADNCEKAVNLHNCIWKLVEREERDEAE